MDKTVSSESSLTATLMVHVLKFENCRDCTETLLRNLLSADLITEFEKQQVEKEPTQIERNR